MSILQEITNVTDDEFCTTFVNKLGDIFKHPVKDIKSIVERRKEILVLDLYRILGDKVKAKFPHQYGDKTLIAKRTKNTAASAIVHLGVNLANNCTSEDTDKFFKESQDLVDNTAEITAKNTPDIVSTPKQIETKTPLKSSSVFPHISLISQAVSELKTPKKDVSPSPSKGQSELLPIFWKKINDMSDKLEKLEKLDKIESGQNQILSRLTNIEQNLKALEKQTKSNVAEISCLKKEISTFDSRIKTLENEDIPGTIKASLIAPIEKHLKMLDGQLSTKCDSTSFDEVKASVHTLNRQLSDLQDGNAPKIADFEPDVTLVAVGLLKDRNENSNSLSELCKRCIGSISSDKIENIVQVKRLGDVQGKNGIVKIQMQSLEDKVFLLRNKKILETSREFQKVYLRSSQTHEERLIEINMKTLLNKLPGLNSELVVSNGKLIQRQQYRPIDFSSMPAQTPPNFVHPFMMTGFPPLSQHLQMPPAQSFQNVPQGSNLFSTPGQPSNSSTNQFVNTAQQPEIYFNQMPPRWPTRQSNQEQFRSGNWQNVSNPPNFGYPYR